MIVGGEDEAGHCPACGHDAADGRFCGRCGKRLRDTLPARALLSAEESPAPVQDEVVWDADGEADDDVAEVRAPDARPHRRVFVAVFTLVAVAAAALVIAGARGPAEVVTTGPSGPGTGVSSTIAATDLTTELWRTSLPVDDDWPPEDPHLRGASEELIFVEHGGGTLVLDRAGRRFHGASWPWPWSWVVGHLDTDPAGPSTAVVVDGDELVTADLATGRVLEAVPLEPFQGQAGPLAMAVPGGDRIITATRELRRVRPDGTTRWSQTWPGEAWISDLRPSDGALLAVGNGGLTVYDLATGDRRWSVESSGGWSSTVAVPGGVAVQDEVGITLYDLETGQERWSAGGVPQPVRLIGVRGEVIYATLAGPGSRVGRYDARTGDRLASLELPAPGGEFDDVPLGAVSLGDVSLVGEVLVVGSGDEVVALGVEGRERWRVRGQSWTALADGTLLVLDGDTVAAVDPVTGDRAGDVQLELPPPIPVHRGTIAISGGSAALPGGRIVDLLTGALLTEVADLPVWQPLEPIPGGYFAGDGPSGHRAAIDPYGRTRWELDDLGGSRVMGRIGDLLLLEVHGPSGPSWSLIDASTGATTDGDVPTSLGWLWVSDGLTAVMTGARHGASEDVVVLRRDGDDLVEAWRGPSGSTHTALWAGTELLERTTRGVRRRALADGSALPSVRLPVVVVASAFGPDTFVFTTADDRVLGVDPETTEVRWETSVDGVRSDRITIAGDVAYLGTFDGRVHLVRLADGELLETVVAGEAPVSQIVVAYGVMLVATGDEVVAFGPSSPADLRIPDLPPRELGEVDVPVP